MVGVLSPAPSSRRRVTVTRPHLFHAPRSGRQHLKTVCPLTPPPHLHVGGAGTGLDVATPDIGTPRTTPLTRRGAERGRGILCRRRYPPGPHRGPQGPTNCRRHVVRGGDSVLSPVPTVDGAHRVRKTPSPSSPSPGGGWGWGVSLVVERSMVRDLLSAHEWMRENLRQLQPLRGNLRQRTVTLDQFSCH